MKTHTTALLLMSLGFPVLADDIAMEDQSQILTGAGDPASRKYF